MERKWIFLQNPFENACSGNFQKANGIFNFTRTRLEAKAGDAFFDTLIALVDAPVTAWNTLYEAWVNSGGAHKSTTLALTSLLADLSAIKIEDWDTAIKNVYRRGTPQYVALLPHGRAPFQKGKQNDRILAVKTLNTAIGTDAALAAVKVAVQTMHGQLKDALTEQQADLGDTAEMSNQLDVLSSLICTIFYNVLGQLMSHYSETPDLTGNYFDLLAIRESEQITFTRTLAPLGNEDIAKRKLTATMSVRVINDGPADVQIYYAAEKNDPVPDTAITVQAGEDETYPASALGSLATGHFIKANNANEVVETHFVLTIIK